MFEKSILELVAEATGTPVEEFRRQQKERREYEQSEEYQDLMAVQRKKEDKDRKIRYQEELTKNYPTDEIVKPTKTNLNKIVQWSTSKWNQYRKAEVVAIFYNSIKRGEDTIKHYHCGTYTEATGGRGTGDYKLVIYKGVAKLIVNEGWDKEYRRVYEFAKPKVKEEKKRMYTTKSLKDIADERLQADVVETKEELFDMLGDDLEKARSSWLEGDIRKIVDYYHLKKGWEENITVEEMIIIDSAFVEVQCVLEEALELLKIKK